MAKDVTFTTDAPLCANTAQRMFEFLAICTAKKADWDIGGTVRERAPGEGILIMPKTAAS